MSNGTFQVYQHYLPATYIRGFKSSFFKGKETVSGFVKIDASKDQIRKRIVPLNATKICGEPLRHTVFIEGVKDNLIEDCFQGLEESYPSFRGMMSQYYSLKECFRELSGKYYTAKKFKTFNSIKSTKVCLFKRLSGIHEIENKDLKNIAFFMSRFLCYRLENMDDYFSMQPKVRLKASAEIMKSILKDNDTYFSDFGSIIERDDWKAILLLLKDGGEFIINASASQVREIYSIYKKLYRFAALPFISLGDESDVRVYLFAPPKSKPLISSDSPFAFNENNPIFSNGCVFTISPHLALFFSKLELSKSANENLSDLISMQNIINAKKYIFSMENERLDLFTKNIVQKPKDLYALKKID